MGGEAAKYGERIHKELEDRITSNKKLGPETVRLEPVVQAIEEAFAVRADIFAEKEMAINTKGEPTGWFAPDVYFRAKLDVLAVSDAKREAVVLDWKTGKRKFESLQLNLSAAMAHLHYDIIAVRAGFVWIKDNKVDMHRVESEDVPAIIKDLRHRTDQIEAAVADGVWEAKPSGLCAYCPVHSCAYNRAQQGRTP
jgi:hypothetical protein